MPSALRVLRLWAPRPLARASLWPVRPLGPASLSAYARGAGAQNIPWDARCLHGFPLCVCAVCVLLLRSCCLCQTATIIIWQNVAALPCVPSALRPFLRTAAGRVRRTSAGTLGAFGASRSAPLGALPFGPCVPWALRPFLRTPAVMFLVFDFSGGDALRRVAPLRLLRGRVSAKNELLKCSVFVGRDKHADVGK